MANLPPKARRAHYADTERAAALAALDANGGDLLRTARQLGIPRTTLQRWARGEVPAGVSEMRQEKKKDLATSLEEIAYKLVDALPGKVESASLQQTATSLAIAIDKMQLLRGQPTAITAAGGLTETERTERVVTLLDTARQRRLQAAG